MIQTTVSLTEEEAKQVFIHGLRKSLKQKRRLEVGDRVVRTEEHPKVQPEEKAMGTVDSIHDGISEVYWVRWDNDPEFVSYYFPRQLGLLLPVVNR